MNQATLGMVLLAALLPTPGGAAAAQDRGDRVDVAILAFKPAGKLDPDVARAADRCAARLAEKLNAAGIRAARLSDATLESLRKDRRAPFAVEQVLEHDRGRFSAELKLMDVASGDELRSYMYGWGDEAGLMGLAEAAAPRIAAAMRESR